MNLAKFILRLAGWKVDITAPDYAKCIVSVAPHTTNWDFILGKLAYASVGRKAGFLMKASWFVFPFGPILRAMGGIPVERKHKTVSLTQVVNEKMKAADRMAIAITPEGTRSRVTEWHKGFLHIAHDAGVPILLGVIDGGSKTLIIRRVFIPTGDADNDLRIIKEYYSQFTALYPERFSTD